VVFESLSKIDITYNTILFIGNCQPEALTLEKTVGYVVHHSVIHGQCSNSEPVEGLKECVGHCTSRTIHERSTKSIKIIIIYISFFLLHFFRFN